MIFSSYASFLVGLSTERQAGEIITLQETVSFRYISLRNKLLWILLAVLPAKCFGEYTETPSPAIS